MVALKAESWTWYALTWVVVIARILSRRILRGSIKKLQVDDALTLVIMVTDTVLIVCMNIISRTNSNLINPHDHVELTPSEISERTFGSKMVVVSEQMQIITTWLVKACLLIMYGRLTMSLKQNVAVKVVAVYVAVGFVVMEILYLGVWCKPFSEYWAVPPDSVQCSAATNHLITNAVFNISSDIMIILIPMPVFLEARLPVKKKLILCCVFGLGVFTIISAILNKYYSFHQPFGSEWTYWYIRESSTAIIAANLPFVWTLLQRTFHLRSFDYRSRERTGSHAATGASRFRSSARHTLPSRSDNDEEAIVGMGSSRRNRGRSADVLDELDEEEYGADTDAEDAGNSRFGRSDSQERINKAYDVMPLKIYQHREVRITESRASDGDETASDSKNYNNDNNSPDRNKKNGGAAKKQKKPTMSRRGSETGKGDGAGGDEVQSDSAEAIVRAPNPTVTTIT